MHMTPLMVRLDREYRAHSGITKRQFYGIFYSRIEPSPLMILGINPGGNPNLGAEAYPEQELADWHHDYVDCDYDIQRVMLPFLKRTLGIDDGLVRRIPKTNVAFRRSSGVGSLKEQQGVSYDDAAKEAEPVLRQIVANVDPKAIIFEGNQAFDQFVYRYCDGESGEPLCAPVQTPNGRHPATIFGAYRVRPNMLDHSVLAVRLGHPSRYGNRLEFTSITDAVSALLTGTEAELRKLP